MQQPTAEIASEEEHVSPRPAPPYDRFDLTGRVALITGGTRGLGRAIIQTLAQAGADVVISSRKQEACDEAAEEARSFGRRVLARACHVGRTPAGTMSPVGPQSPSTGGRLIAYCGGNLQN